MNSRSISCKQSWEQWTENAYSVTVGMPARIVKQRKKT